MAFRMNSYAKTGGGGTAPRASLSPRLVKWLAAALPATFFVYATFLSTKDVCSGHLRDQHFEL